MPSGTPRKLTIEGVPFRVAADVNINVLFTEYENSKVPTSGQPMDKKVRRTPQAESVVLITDWAEKVVLRDWAESFTNYKFSIEFAGGDIIKCEGTFDVQSDESEENRTTITILPSGKWTVFTA